MLLGEFTRVDGYGPSQIDAADRFSPVTDLMGCLSDPSLIRPSRLMDRVRYRKVAESRFGRGPRPHGHD